MGKTARLEPAFDRFDDDFEADSELDILFDEDLDSYLDKQDAISDRVHHKKLGIDEFGHHRLPSDWQNFDYSDDDWDS